MYSLDTAGNCGSDERYSYCTDQPDPPGTPAGQNVSGYNQWQAPAAGDGPDDAAGIQPDCSKERGCPQIPDVH